jgi:hypothetical protein
MGLSLGLGVGLATGLGSFKAPPATLNIVVDGNSIGAGVSGFPPGTLLGIMVGETACVPTVSTIAVAGQATTDRIAAAPTDLQPLYNPDADANVAFLIEIINDAGSGDAAACAAHVEEWCGLARSYGFKAVVVLGCHRDNGPVGINTVIDDANALIRTGWRSYADGIVDPIQDPRLANNEDVRYFAPDGGAWVHLNFNGDLILASLMMTKLRAMYGLPFTPGQLPGCQYCLTAIDSSRIFNASGDPISDGEDVASVIGYGLQAGPSSRATGTGFTYEAAGLAGKPCFSTPGGIAYLATPTVTRSEMCRVVIARWTGTGTLISTEGGYGYLGGVVPYSTYYSDGSVGSQWNADVPDYYVSETKTQSIVHQYRGTRTSEELRLNLSPVSKSAGLLTDDPSIVDANMGHYLGDATYDIAPGKYLLDYFGNIWLTDTELERLLNYVTAQGYTLSTDAPETPAPDAAVMAASPALYLDAGDESQLYSDLGTTLVTGSGDLVRQMNDKSGSGHNATAVGDPNRFEYITNVLNGRGACRIDPTARGGQGKALMFNIGATGTGLHLFLVSKQPSAPNAWVGQFDLSDPAISATHFPYADGNIYDGTCSISRHVIGNPGSSIPGFSWNAFHIYEVEVSATAWTARMDGVQLYQAAGDFRNLVSAGRIGGNSSGFQFMDGWLAMMVIYNYALGASRTGVYNNIKAICGL